jgi:hypothetical protein
VVFVDYLVNPEVLRHTNERARVVWVGKRGGCASTPQAFIERAMVREATQGREVVRLKGGDLMIFGGGGEELTALRAAGLAAEVVNGITSGLAAVTGLGGALTQRAHAQGVVLLTGHSHQPGQGQDWCQVGQAMASLRLTLVVYVGVEQLTSIAHGLTQSLPGHTRRPWCSTPRCRSKGNGCRHYARWRKRPKPPGYAAQRWWWATYLAGWPRHRKSRLGAAPKKSYNTRFCCRLALQPNLTTENHD